MSTIRNRSKHTTPQAKLWQNKKVRDRWRDELFQLSRHYAVVRVGLVLSEKMNCRQGGYAWLRRKKLMELACVSVPNNVSRALTKLEKAGLITRYVYGPELARVFPVKLNPDACQSVYTLHTAIEARSIRDWHEERGIPLRAGYSYRKSKHRVTKTPSKPFEVIAFPGSVKESPQSG
jgi:hypothetical protein